MKQLKIILLAWIMCYAFWGMAQQPSHRIVGADFFAEVDIYSLIEDEQHNKLIATDRGLFKYDGYQFIELSNPNLKNKSLFGLTKDNHGAIFCYNLGGQIVKVEKDSLLVYYEIPDTLLSSFVSINFDNLNQLFISRKKFFVVDANKKARVVYGFGDISQVQKGSTVSKNKDGALVTVLGFNNIGYFKDNEFKCLFSNCMDITKKEYAIYANSTDEIVSSSAIVFKKTNTTWSPIKIEREEEIAAVGANVFFLNANQLWFACYNRGVYAYDVDGKTLYGGKKIFPQYRISATLEDTEGNLWLGTFKKGLVFIPHLEVVDFSNNPLLKDEEIKCFVLGNKKDIYLGSENGNIYQIDSEYIVKLITDVHKQGINKMVYFEQKNALFFDGIWLNLNNPSVKNQYYSNGIYPSVKEIQKINQKEAVIATNIGVSYIHSEQKTPSEDNILKRIGKPEPRFNDWILPIGRTNCLYYDTLNQKIWAGTSTGLQVLEKDSITKIYHEKKAVVATSITASQQAVYIATEEGILVFEKQRFKTKITAENGLLSNNVNKISIYKNYLFIATNKGLQRLDLQTNKWLNFEISDGLLSNRILDFVVDGNLLWVLTAQGIQQVYLPKLNQTAIQLLLEFVNIKVNDQQVSITNRGAFNYNENKIDFEFIAKTYRNQSSLKYLYRLEGLSDTWETVSYENNRMVYNSLPPGFYTFWLKAIDSKGNESKLISYAFDIALPYWQTWWFILLTFLGIALFVTLFFLMRIRILKRENKLLLDKKAIEKELIESRQTALRSQMNPHFLYNALNSIQEMIMVNEKRLAGKYLGKFADLMRIYLNHSRQNKIKLSEEIEALELYLELEKIRFEETLTINFEVDRELDTDFITVPSMLIQPYIENAIKHGLLHKEKERVLTIIFKKEKKNNLFLCEIIDNGIGRKQSAIINQMRNPHHESFSTSATQKRLELLNYESLKPIKAEIIDLVDKQGKGIGTKVVLAIPIQ